MRKFTKKCKISSENFHVFAHVVEKNKNYICYNGDLKADRETWKISRILTQHPCKIAEFRQFFKNRRFFRKFVENINNKNSIVQGFRWEPPRSYRLFKELYITFLFPIFLFPPNGGLAPRSSCKTACLRFDEH